MGIGLLDSPHCGLFGGLRRGDVRDDLDGLDSINIVVDPFFFVSLIDHVFPPYVNGWIDPHPTTDLTHSQHETTAVGLPRDGRVDYGDDLR